MRRQRSYTVLGLSTEFVRSRRDDVPAEVTYVQLQQRYSDQQNMLAVLQQQNMQLRRDLYLEKLGRNEALDQVESCRQGAVECGCLACVVDTVLSDRER